MGIDTPEKYPGNDVDERPLYNVGTDRYNVLSASIIPESNFIETQSNYTVQTPPSSGNSDPLTDAQNVLLEAGLDPASFWEQRIVWGDQDPFQHVNNVRYARFFESARIKWMMSIGEEWGGRSRAESMIRGQGVSLILKAMEIQFRRPVTYPDTLLLGYAPLPPATDDDETSFQVVASAYSLTAKKFVAHSKETVVWYDYDRLIKCSPPMEVAKIVSSRIPKA